MVLLCCLCWTCIFAGTGSVWEQTGEQQQCGREAAANWFPGMWNKKACSWRKGNYSFPNRSYNWAKAMCCHGQRVSSFTPQAWRSGSYRPEGWKMEGENLIRFRYSYGCTGHTNKGDYWMLAVLINKKTLAAKFNIICFICPYSHSVLSYLWGFYEDKSIPTFSLLIRAMENLNDKFI